MGHCKTLFFFCFVAIGLAVLGFGCTSENEEEGVQEHETDTDSAREIEDNDADSETNTSGSGLPENTLFLAFNSQYLLDNLQASSGEYLEKHKTTIQVSPAFFGRIGDVEIPESGAPGIHYEVFGLKKENSVVVLQMSFDETTHKPHNPFIQVSLDADKIVSGETYALDPADPLSRGMVFFVEDNLAFGCVSGVIEGQVTVTKASNIDLGEGGLLWLHGSDLKVTGVENSSAGDLTGSFNKEDKWTCDQTDGV